VRLPENRDAYHGASKAATVVIPDVDMWRAANLLVKRHGHDAAIVAAQRADECLAAGDDEGQRIWKRIVDAILELQRTELEHGEHVN